MIISSVVNGWRFKMTNENFEDKDIYTEEGIENYVDEDEISTMEQGFMLGYLEA